jgi:outer membrane receptor for ferrienterochelin and colicins
MPIVSGLSTVWFVWNPNSLLERIEIKGPASSLCEAVEDFNIITKIQNAPVFLLMPSSTGEVNVDIGFKANIGNAAAINWN